MAAARPTSKPSWRADVPTAIRIRPSHRSGMIGRNRLTSGSALTPHRHPPPARRQRRDLSRRQGSAGAARALAGQGLLFAARRPGRIRRIAAHGAASRGRRGNRRCKSRSSDLAGWREVLPGAGGGGHYLIMSFAARWIAREPVLNDEHDDFRWLDAGRARRSQGHRRPAGGHRRRPGGWSERRNFLPRLRALLPAH